MKLTRTCKLAVYGNNLKTEEMRYNASRYLLYVQHFLTQLHFQPHKKFLSTAGMGLLANQAQKLALGMLKAERALAQEQARSATLPKFEAKHCPGSIKKAKRTQFNYWVDVTSQWSASRKPVRIPLKSHTRLNSFLRKGWELSDRVDFVLDKNGKWYCLAYVTKEVSKPEPKRKCLGIDVGVAHGVCRSDNYKSKSLYPIIQKEKQAQASRQRNKHKKKFSKTILKQQLDKEVTRALTRCKLLKRNLVVEHPKSLANLRGSRLSRWARSYFANRATTRAVEEGIHVVWINPAYTSITCNHCGHIDKQSRVKRDTFKCTSCKSEFHADINAARNIARKGFDRLAQKRKPVGIILKDSLEVK